MAATCAAPVFGQLGDVFGRKRLLFVALAIFAAGCLGCALAPSLPALILAIPAGQLADRVDRRYVTAAGNLGALVGNKG